MATSASNNNKSSELEIKEEKYSSVQGRSEITIDEQMVKYHKSSNSTRAHARRSAYVCVHVGLLAATRTDTNGQGDR